MKYAKKIFITLFFIIIAILSNIPITSARNINNEEYNKRLQEAREITESINPTKDSFNATTTNNNTTNDSKSIKKKSFICIVFIVILFSFWLICNYLLKIIMSQYHEINDFVKSALFYRKTIMFNIFSLLFLYIFDVKFFKYIAIVYYIVIILTEGILIAIAVISGLKDKTMNHTTNKSLWTLTISKVLNEIASILMLIFSYQYL